MSATPLTRLVFMENGEISAIYSRSEALSLTEGQLAVMGLRPFQAARFPGGRGISLQAGGCISSISNFLYAGRAADFRGRHLFGPKRQNPRHRRAQWRRKIYVVPYNHRTMPCHGNVQIDGAYLKRKRRTKQSFFVQQMPTTSSMPPLW